MIVGLHVRDCDRPDRGAVRVVELGWTSPPPLGASWTCCRRAEITGATVAVVSWAGLDDDPDVWVTLDAPVRTVRHLTDKHGFGWHNP